MNLADELHIEKAHVDKSDLDNELLGWLFRVAVKLRADIKKKHG